MKSHKIGPGTFKARDTSSFLKTMGKLVHQLPGVVTFAYDLCFRRMIAHWKGIIEEIHFGGSIMPLDIIENLDLEKPSFGPSKWPGS
jgi:hypothetical protein